MNDGLSSRWHATRDTLATLLHWLDDTKQWVETTASEEFLSSREETQDLSSRVEERPQESGPDLYTLLAALTALRQEVRLQTRSARHDREQAAQMLEQLSQAVGQFDSLRQAESSRSTTAVQEAERAAVEALIEVHDALSRATRQAERLVESTAMTLRQWSGHLQQTQGRMAARSRRRWSWLRRRRQQQSELLQQFGSDAGQMADRLAGLAMGYRLSVERLERVLAAYGIIPMVCLGQPVDAEQMEVVQVMIDPTQPPGVVCDEVRRGYRRHGQVYRFAQVVATRATPLAAPGEQSEEK